MVGDVTWVKAHYDSIHGRIVSNWQRHGGKLKMDVTIPANTTATVHGQAPGVQLLGFENRAAVCEVGSGNFFFESTLPQSTK